jgi:hypothetical protein
MENGRKPRISNEFRETTNMGRGSARESARESPGRRASAGHPAGDAEHSAINAVIAARPAK